MALIDLGGDTVTWQQEYESAEALHLALVGLFNERNEFLPNSINFDKLSNCLHQKCNQLFGEIQSLRAHLESLSNSGQLTAREKERRNLLIENLVRKYKQNQQNLSGSNTAQEDLSYSPQKASLNQQPSVSSSAMESQDISHQSSQQMQSRVMEEQDRGLEELSKIIGRQRQMAQAIGEEVESQNDLIDNITDHVDRTRDRMTHQTNRIALIDRKDKTWGYWFVILFLLVAIVVVAIIPKTKE